MAFAQRKALYEEIEQYRGRPLICYVTSTRPNLQALMAQDAFPEFIDQLDAITDTSKGLDVLLHSNGGDPLAAWKLMSLIRERFKKVAVLVPMQAFSAATVFALGADEIAMHPNAALGPIDPQLAVRLPDGSAKQFGYEDVASFIKFTRDEAGLSDQKYVQAAFDKLCQTVEPVALGAARRGAALMTTFGEKLLRMHMIGPAGREKAARISQSLGKSYFSHGHALSRTEAQELQLKVASPTPTLESLLWRVYEDFEVEMQLREPWDPMAYCFSSPDAAHLVEAPPHVTIPTGLPPQAAQQLLQQAMQAAQATLIKPGVSVPYSLTFGLMESCRHASKGSFEGRVIGFRTPNMEFKVSLLGFSAKWAQVPLP